jgi:hypothetical protein
MGQRWGKERYEIILTFNKQDGGRSGRGAYVLTIPIEDIERIVPIIKSNPAIMIELYKAFFPHYFALVRKYTLDPTKVVFTDKLCPELT